MPKHWDERYEAGLDEDDEEFDDEEDVDEVIMPVPRNALGPDERDMDLIDGSYEREYYAGKHRGRDWNSIGLAVGLLVVIAMILPGILVMVR